jgi:isoquinoline 1-oxidoreductase subunit beta
LKKQVKSSRRAFVVNSAFIAIGILSEEAFSSEISNTKLSLNASRPFLVPNSWLKLHNNGKVEIVVDRVEMGQGIATTHCILVANELGLVPTDINFTLAQNHKDFVNPEFGLQLTGGSTSTKVAYKTIRNAAATLRQAIEKATLAKLKLDGVSANVTEQNLVFEGGKVAVFGSEKRYTFEDLFDEISKQKFTLAKPKSLEKSNLLGKKNDKIWHRVDGPQKCNGTAVFGIDAGADIPNLLHAAIIMPQWIGASSPEYNDKEILKMPGIKKIFSASFGVVIVAEKYYQAKNAKQLLQVSWKNPSVFSSEKWQEEAFQQIKSEQQAGKGNNEKSEGSVKNAFATANKLVEAEYSLPYLAHATLEPQNCTAWVKQNEVEIWAPTQGPGMAAEVASKVTGISVQKIKIHQTYLGGGFGRRISQDYVFQAVTISQELKAPVKLIWTREDDFKHDIYRPSAAHKFRAKVLNSGLDAWEHRIAAPSILAHVLPDFTSEMLPSWLPHSIKFGMGRLLGKTMKGTVADMTSTEGANTFGYKIPNIDVFYHFKNSPVPLGFWRSVGHSGNAFAVECFIDECAVAAGVDPAEMRIELLKATPKTLKVLQLALEKSDYKQKKAQGKFLGVAISESFGSVVCHVAEVEKIAALWKVSKVVSAVDCGLVIDENGAKAQVEGSVIFGMSAAFYGKIDFQNGAVVQNNFYDHPLLRIGEAPIIEVHFVELEINSKGSLEPQPTGLGEPAVPPVAPAIANAFYFATGKRVRSLPFKLQS